MRQLYDLQEGLCAHCQKLMAHPDDVRACRMSLAPDAPTIDHVVPYAHGGPFVVWNLLLAHRSCNEARKDGPLPPCALEVHNRIFELTYAHPN